MRPPWIEAGPMLAAAGHRLAPPEPPLTPWKRLMNQNIDYAFLTRIDAVAKPTIVGSLDRLAQLIEARRHGQAIMLEEVGDLHARRRMATGDSPAAPEGLRDRGVQIWTQLLDGGRDRSIGFAWLKGGGIEELQQALTKIGLRKGVDPRLPMVA